VPQLRRNKILKTKNGLPAADQRLLNLHWERWWYYVTTQALDILLNDNGRVRAAWRS
jgi:hypothetical protein